MVGVTYRGDPRAWRSSSKSRSYSNEVPSVTSTLEKTTRTLATVTTQVSRGEFRCGITDTIVIDRWGVNDPYKYYKFSIIIG